MTRLAGLLTFIVALHPAYAWSQGMPAVFVTIDRAAEELSSQKREDLSDSARDLRERIEKRTSLRATRERAEADIVVTILDRRVEVHRTGQTNYGGGNTQTHYQSRYVVAFRIQAGAFVQETETALAGAFVTWKRVAGTIAKDIEAWAEEHREELFRGTKPK